MRKFYSQFEKGERGKEKIDHKNKNRVLDTMKLNCWEFKKCGREPGGEKVNKLRICPAATEKLYKGINGGKNAGRYCWKVDGTLCRQKIKGSTIAKLMYCTRCDFFKLVQQEEEKDFQI